MRVRTVLLGGLAVLVAALVVHSEATPISHPIFLEPTGSPGHEASMRPVCAAWLDISRTPTTWGKEWWIAVPKGGSLYSEVRSAKKVEFETDPGSGLSDVCVAEELPFQARSDVVNAVIAACKPTLSLGRSREAPEDQVALHLVNQYDAAGCERPVGTPTLHRAAPSD